MSTATLTDTFSQFRDALAAYNLNPPELIADGKIHRFDASDDKRGAKSAWYILHDDSLPAGSFGNWKTDDKGTWCSKAPANLSPIERQQHQERIQQAREQAEAAKLAQQIATAKRCTELWNNATEASEDNPYLKRKGIKAFGVREFKNTQTLVIPIRDEAAHITSLQFIDKDGGKKFKGGGRIEGGYYSFGGKPIDTVLICEGFATGASLHLATGLPVAVAFNAGNIEAIAKILRAKFPTIRLILCADNDRFKSTGNKGLKSATKAAKAVSGLLAVPQFNSDENEPTDFNDLHQLEGLKAVKAAIDGALSVSLPKDGKEETGWPEPEALARSTTAAPYPLDALPQVVRLAVDEVHSFTKAPLAMVACSALANLSLAAQAHYDVQRAEKLTGAISLYFLVIAESGERKSTCDGIFSSAIRHYETQQQEDAKPAIKEYNAEKSIWDATKSGLLDAIKQNAKGKSKDGLNADQLERELINHEKKEPTPPRVPRLIYSDFTPEALTHSLGTKWPSGGVISSEAGAVFGSHGMGKDSQMRTLANLNQLWDATKLTFDRRGESYTVEGARLTISLQVQESTLMEFFNKTGTLARGTGFLARFLMAHPESTQGTRKFTEPPENMPALADFHQQINRILQAPAPINDRGGLDTVMLTLSPEAKEAWVKFHDAIEEGLGKGGELQDVRDVASKIADNAARLAALFHTVDNGIGAISLEHFESASIIAAWHLNEALRFFGELALPEELADAAKLDDWLINHCKTNSVDVVSTRTITQYAPYKLRDKAKRDNAIQELIDHGRIVLLKEGKRQEIQINPKLLED